MNLGPQFDQPTLPGMGEGGGEQMTLFRTKELGDGTMRGSYNTAPHAKDWVESATREKATPRQVDEEWSAPVGGMEFGQAFSEEHLTEAAYDRLQEGGDLAAKFSRPGPADTQNLVEGGRAHLAHLAQGPGVEKKFMGDFSKGTDFGDNRLHAKPYDFRELEFIDSPTDYDREGLYAAFTPEGEQVSGMEYRESDVLPRAQVIGGAGTGRPFMGRGYGKMTAARMAAERSFDSVVLHGNSFTNAGKGAFQSKGAKSESQIHDEVEYRASNDPDVLEVATEDYSTPELAKWAGFSEEEDRPEFRYDYDEAADTIKVQDNVLDRQSVAKLAATGSGGGSDYAFYNNPIRGSAREVAKDYLHDRMLGEQQEMISPFREYLGVPDRASTYGQPKQPRLEDDPSDQSMVVVPPNEDRLTRGYYNSGRPVKQDFLSKALEGIS